MIKNTFRFWLAATLVLAVVYLVSNPSMASRVGSRVSGLWHEVISRVVKAPKLLATLEATDQEELVEPEQVIKPILEEPAQTAEGVLRPAELQRINPNQETASQQDEKVQGNYRGHEKVVQMNPPKAALVPEVKLEDVLIPQEEKSPIKVRATPAVSEKAIPLEVLKKIYARHLEALKILNSEAVDEQKKNEK